MNRRSVTILILLTAGVFLFFSACSSLVQEVEEIIDVEIQEEEAPSPALEPAPSAPSEERPADSEFAAAEREIFRLVNERRSERNLPPLLFNAELASVAREHSIDMGERNFYSHRDPQGTTPNQRIERRMGDRYYLQKTAENIAYKERSDGFIGISQEEIARAFMQSWMKSPGHRANILRSGISHIGIGLHQEGTRIFATQNFISYIAKLTDPPPSSELRAKEAIVKFQLNTHLLEKDSLTVLVNLPDKTAKWPTSGGSYYRGIAYIEAKWLGDGEFAVELPVRDYGKGSYSIQLGSQGDRSIHRKKFTFSVK